MNNRLTLVRQRTWLGLVQKPLIKWTEKNRVRKSQKMSVRLLVNMKYKLIKIKTCGQPTRYRARLTAWTRQSPSSAQRLKSAIARGKCAPSPIDFQFFSLLIYNIHLDAASARTVPTLHQLGRCAICEKSGTARKRRMRSFSTSITG